MTVEKLGTFKAPHIYTGCMKYTFVSLNFLAVVLGAKYSIDWTAASVLVRTMETLDVRAVRKFVMVQGKNASTEIDQCIRNPVHKLKQITNKLQTFINWCLCKTEGWYNKITGIHRAKIKEGNILADGEEN